jgi:hypothetical protein
MTKTSVEDPQADPECDISACNTCKRFLVMYVCPFDTMVHGGERLKALSNYAAKASGRMPREGKRFRDLKRQNDLLKEVLFGVTGNPPRLEFLYHNICVQEIFKISKSRLLRLKKEVLGPLKSSK